MWDVHDFYCELLLAYQTNVKSRVCFVFKGERYAYTTISLAIFAFGHRIIANWCKTDEMEDDIHIDTERWAEKTKKK